MVRPWSVAFGVGVGDGEEKLGAAEEFAAEEAFLAGADVVGGGGVVARGIGFGSVSAKARAPRRRLFTSFRPRRVEKAEPFDRGRTKNQGRHRCWRLLPVPVAGSGCMRHPAGTVRVSTSTLAGVLCPNLDATRTLQKGRVPPSGGQPVSPRRVGSSRRADDRGPLRMFRPRRVEKAAPSDRGLPRMRYTRDCAGASSTFQSPLVEAPRGSVPHWLTFKTKALSQTPSAPVLPAGFGPLVGPSLSRRGGPRSIHSRHRRSAGLTSPPCDETQEGWHGWKVGRA